jgi:hypothetical protein
MKRARDDAQKARTQSHFAPPASCEAQYPFNATSSALHDDDVAANLTMVDQKQGVITSKFQESVRFSGLSELKVRDDACSAHVHVQDIATLFTPASRGTAAGCLGGIPGPLSHQASFETPEAPLRFRQVPCGKAHVDTDSSCKADEGVGVISGPVGGLSTSAPGSDSVDERVSQQSGHSKLALVAQDEVKPCQQASGGSAAVWEKPVHRSSAPANTLMMSLPIRRWQSRSEVSLPQSSRSMRGSLGFLS